MKNTSDSNQFQMTNSTQTQFLLAQASPPEQITPELKTLPQMPIWQVSFPICAVIIFAIGALTTHFMVGGRYRFHFEIGKEGLKIKTDIDKR